MKLNSIQKKWIYRALIMLIFIFAFGIRVHYLSEKKDFHVDEVLSVVLSDYKAEGWTDRIPEGEYSGAELQNRIFNIDKSSNGLVGTYNFLSIIPEMQLKDTIADIIRLWDNNRDTPHTNFYYTLLRISLIGIDTDDRDEFESQYVIRAGALNLILFVFSFLAFLWLLKLITDDKALILLGLFVAFANKIDISTAVYFRPYVLQSLCFIVFTSFLIYVSKKIKLGEYKDSWQNIFIFALPLSLMLLSGYYAFLYAFLLILLFIVFPLRRAGRLDLCIFFFFGSILAFLYDVLFYNNFMAGFYSYRTSDSLGMGSRKFSLLNAVSETIDVISDSFLSLPVLILLAIVVIYKLFKKDSFALLKEYAWVLFAGLIFFIVIKYVSPFKTFRYVSPAAFIVALIFPLVLSSTSSALFKKLVSVFFVSIFLFMLIFKQDKLYEFEDIDKLYSFSGVEELKNREDSIYIHVATPAVFSECILYLDKDQRYTVCYDTENLLEKTTKAGSIVIFNDLLDVDFDNSMVDAGIDLTEYGFKRIETKKCLFKIYIKK